MLFTYLTDWGKTQQQTQRSGKDDHEEDDYLDDSMFDNHKHD